MKKSINFSLSVAFILILLSTYYENEWILNIADLVVTDQNISNDGVKLLKLRFYPVATTLYE